MLLHASFYKIQLFANYICKIRNQQPRLAEYKWYASIAAIHAFHNLDSYLNNMRPIYTTVILLAISNVFMTFAWYAHLKEMSNKPWIVAALISWGIALFEYLFQVPANRIGYTELSVAQLKIIQEVISLSVFVPFAYFYLKEPIKLDYLWAGLCIMGAVFFIFRSRIT